MADPFADPSDVAARWRPLTTQETSTAAALCEDASAVLRARFPGIDGQLSPGGLDPAVLTMVCAGMVKRAMLGGTDGISQETQTLPGGFSRGQSFANPLGNVFLTAQDLILILGYQPAGQSNQFANDTTKCGVVGDGVNLSYETLTILGP